MTEEYRHNGGPSMAEPVIDAIADHISNPPPYFQFWWDDFWSSCARVGMRPEEVGGFLAALTMQWTMAGRFDSDEGMRRMHFLTGWDIRTCRSLVSKLVSKGKMSETNEGYIVSQRMQDEITKFCERKRASLIREERKREGRIEQEIDPKIDADVAPDVTPDVRRDLSKKPNRNNKSDNHREPVRAIVASESQRYNTPPTPPLGGQSPKENSRGKRAAKTRAEAAQRQAQVAALVAAYNDRATTHGWRRCEVITDQRAKRLLKRVAEIGGPDRFVSALDAIPGDDWLSGRVAGRDGSMFRLDIDRLLSTGSGMGDVLARMLEVATAPSADPDPVNGQTWGWWRGKEDQLRSLDPDRWEAAIAKHRPNGTWPWWIMGAPPGHEECVVPDAIVDKYGYVEIYQGKIHHV